VFRSVLEIPKQVFWQYQSKINSLEISSVQLLFSSPINSHPDIKKISPAKARLILVLLSGKVYQRTGLDIAAISNAHI
jgi:hypothetical protein